MSPPSPGCKEDLAKAEKAGDQRKIKAAQEALDARQAWLDQIQRSASELSWQSVLAGPVPVIHIAGAGPVLVPGRPGRMAG